MRKSVHHVLDQSSGPRRLDAVAGHIAYEDGDTSFLDFEHVVEVTADAGGLGGRAVEMAHLEGADLGGGVEKRLLELLGDPQLLLVEALVLRGQHPEPLLADLQPLQQLLSIIDGLREHGLARLRPAADVVAGETGQPGGQRPEHDGDHDGRPVDAAAEVGEEREIGRSAHQGHDHPRQRPGDDGGDHRDERGRRAGDAQIVGGRFELARYR